SAAFPPHSPPTSFPSLFERFIGTMPLSDSSGTCMRAVRPEPSPTVLPLSSEAGISEVSRFSCMKFLGVSGVFDYAGLNRNSRYRSGSCCLPRITRTSASGLHLFGALLPTPPIPLFTLRRVPRGTQRKTRGRADRYSLLVRIFHSLLHAGLARRTVEDFHLPVSAPCRAHQVERSRDGGSEKYYSGGNQNLPKFSARDRNFSHFHRAR